MASGDRPGRRGSLRVSAILEALRGRALVFFVFVGELRGAFVERGSIAVDSFGAAMKVLVAVVLLGTVVLFAGFLALVLGQLTLMVTAS